MTAQENSENKTVSSSRPVLTITKATTKAEVIWYKKEVHKNITLKYSDEMRSGTKRPSMEVSDKVMLLLSCKKHGVYIVHLGKKRIGGFAVLGSRHNKYKTLFGFFLLESYRGYKYGYKMLDWIHDHIGLSNLTFGSRAHKFVHGYINYKQDELPGIQATIFPLVNSVESYYLFYVSKKEQRSYTIDYIVLIDEFNSIERPWNALKYNKLK